MGYEQTNDRQEGRRRALPLIQRPLLLLIDFQRLFTDPASPAYIDGVDVAISKARVLVSAFERRGFPILRTRHVHPAGDEGGVHGMFWDRLQRAEDPLSEPCPLVEAFAGRVPLFDKARASALHSLRVTEAVAHADAVVIVGVQTQVCVLATALDVARQDVRPIVVGEACAARSEAAHDAALEVLASGHAHVVDVDTLISALGEGRR